MKWEICYDCKRRKPLTKHHIKKDGEYTGVCVIVCRDCHDIREIEEGVRKLRKRHRARFLNRLTPSQRERLAKALKTKSISSLYVRTHNFWV